MYPVCASGIRFDFDPVCGFIRNFSVTDQGRAVAPLHRAPWVGTPEVMAPDTVPHLAGIEGDFFCAPFAQVADGAEMHGWPANAVWSVQPGTHVRAVLGHAVNGATLIKELTLTGGHPFLYQRHIFVGGSGSIGAANHAMVSLPQGGILRFSPKRWFESAPATPEGDPARGRSTLRYPARASDPAAFPTAAGGSVDLRRYPWAARSDDFAVGVEAPGHSLGWTAVTRPAEGDLYLSLRHAQRLPMTMLWHSNGGRDYPPWNSRHFSCLGVEEGAAVYMLGESGTMDPDPLTAAGQSALLTLDPDRTTEVRHVIGAIAWPTGQAVARITAAGDSLTITGESGAERVLPWRGGFLD